MGCVRGSTSIIFKVGAFLLFLGFTFHIIGFASPFWRLNGTKADGLWQVCENGVCSNTVVAGGIYSAAWFVCVQVLQSAGLLFALIANLIAVTIMCSPCTLTSKSHLIAITTFVYLAGLVVLVGTVVFGVIGATTFPSFALGFAFFLTIPSAVLYLIAGVLFSLDIDADDKLDE